MMCSRQIVTRVKNFVIVGHSFRFPSLDRNHDVRGAIPREPYRCESAGKASPAAFTSLLSTFKNSDYDPFSGGWFQHLAFVNSSLFGALPIRAQFFEFRDESSFSIVDRNSQLGAMPPWLIRFLSRFAQNLGGWRASHPNVVLLTPPWAYGYHSWWRKSDLARLVIGYIHEPGAYGSANELSHLFQ